MSSISQSMIVFSPTFNNGFGQFSVSVYRRYFEDLKLTVTWSYHPDKGLEVTYKK